MPCNPSTPIGGVLIHGSARNCLRSASGKRAVSAGSHWSRVALSVFASGPVRGRHACAAPRSQPPELRATLVC